MTADELKNHEYIQVKIGGKTSKLQILEENGSFSLEGNISQAQGGYWYQRPISQALLDELSENEEGLIEVTHKQLLDNADE